MRVVYVSHSKEVGGAELHLEGLMARLQATADRQATLVCRRDQALDEWVRRIEAGAISVRRLDLRSPAAWSLRGSSCERGNRRQKLARVDEGRKDRQALGWTGVSSTDRRPSGRRD